MPGLMRYGTRVARPTRLVLFPPISLRRSFIASLVSGLLVILTAAGAEPKEAPPPRPQSTDIAGSLVIVGGGGMPDAICNRFLELAGGKKGRLVVIPTASEQADRTNIYRGFDFWKRQGLASVSMLNTLDPKKANDPAFVKPLTEATAAWLSGGDQTRLANAYHGTAVERELRRLLARGGVIGGTSAGASVMSAVMITGGNPEARVAEGFGLLPDVIIDQHFQNRKRQKRLLGVLEKHPRCLGLGIDEQTAVVVHGHTFTVMGKANVSVCLPPVEREHDVVQLLKSGDAGDLLQLNQRVMARVKPATEHKPAVAKEGRATTP